MKRFQTMKRLLPFAYMISATICIGLLVRIAIPTEPTSNPEEQSLGGITRVAIGTQTKWTTDLIPSASFTVNLGSSTLPVNKLWTTGASVSINF